MNTTLDTPLRCLQGEQESITTPESPSQLSPNQEEPGQKSIDYSFANIDTRLADRKKSNVKRRNKLQEKTFYEQYQEWKLPGILRNVSLLEKDMEASLRMAGVYFITYKGDEEKVKIGKGKCVHTRMRSYLTTHYREIKVLCVVRSKVGSEGYLEKEMHNYFAECRYNREWFDFNDRLKRGIECIKKLNSFQPYVINREGSEVYETTD